MKPENNAIRNSITILLDQMSDDQLDKCLKELQGKEHDPEECGCEYIGGGLWSCGHEDQGIPDYERQDPAWQGGGLPLEY